MVLGYPNLHLAFVQITRQRLKAVTCICRGKPWFLGDKFGCYILDNIFSVTACLFVESLVQAFCICEVKGQQTKQQLNKKTHHKFSRRHLFLQNKFDESSSRRLIES
ncbi:hypothetical protein Nepgr_014434 [Nepenthes gracilis]|uniref:Uncharacterized protein n=1 Tax=Nepenthes gracilis TaxID=150966 RepID=A0AAD3SK05_NEPGR|nr:hypothetical protein Nepgr_014434 [Nepenthes gracilis]